jgi:hypothetical protein
MPSLSYREIERAVRDASEGLPVLVTPEARDIIATTLHAIVSDPSPRWRGTREQMLEGVQHEMIDRLPKLLLEFGGRVDTFSLLHRLGQVLDRICPFEKAR